MSLAQSFGSFGDILSIVQLALAIAKAVKDTGGTSAGVRALTEDLVSFSRAVSQVREILEEHPTQLTLELREDIERPLSICHETLKTIHTRIATYRARSARNVFAKYRAIIAWNMAGGYCKVQAMKQRLWEQIGKH
ncbi:hypothetical protein AURDEDRAFT_163837 [Auricularia subglabra TFB-10046 SS5]|nr:hypothetical protein AURDEDRAFT_163837 [Auricularia subglabra TFB-10046 SS5]